MSNPDIDKFQSKRKIKRAIKKAQKKYDVDKAIIEESVAKQYLKMICSCIYKKVDETDSKKREDAYKLNITVRQSRQSGVARATCPD